VAVVRTAVSDGWQITFFVNGELVPTCGTTGLLKNDPRCNPDPVMVGNYGFIDDPSACEFNGDIDGVRLFPRALTQAEVAEQYVVQGCTVTAPGLSWAGALATAMLLAGCGVLVHRRRRPQAPHA
jgi:hypothetical protein